MNTLWLGILSISLWIMFRESFLSLWWENIDPLQIDTHISFYVLSLFHITWVLYRDNAVAYKIFLALTFVHESSVRQPGGHLLASNWNQLIWASGCPPPITEKYTLLCVYSWKPSSPTFITLLWSLGNPKSC